MSARLTARQNQIRLITVFICTVVLVLLFQFYKTGLHREDTGLSSQAETTDGSLFMGLRHATPSEIHSALPQAAGKPTLIDFSSRLCHDCQRMAPIISKLVPQHPELYFKKFDVLEDQKKAPAVFRIFKPVSVPMLVLVNPKGEIKNVLYNYQKPEVVSAAIAKLEARSAASPARKTTPPTHQK